MKPAASNADIGDRIRIARAEKRLSQQTLADKIGVAQHAISQYENGTRSVSVSLLKALARELDKPFSFFIADGDEVLLVKNTRLHDLILEAQRSSEAFDLICQIGQFALSKKVRLERRQGKTSPIYIPESSEEG